MCYWSGPNFRLCCVATQLENAPMADNSKPTPTNLELLTKTMNELAQEIGTMEPDDPKRTAWRRVLSNLTEVRIFLKSRRDELIGQRMDDDCCVLAGLDNFVEITNRALADSYC